MREGDWYVIRNNTLSGEEKIEGTAQLVKPGSRPGTWWVRFETEIVEREVRPEDKSLLQSRIVPFRKGVSFRRRSK